MKRLFTYLTLLLMMVSCGGATTQFDASLFDEVLYAPTHATGFKILHSEQTGATLITVSDPWQGASNVEQMLVIDPESHFSALPSNVKRIGGPAQRIVCMSSSYVAMLSAIGCHEQVVGVSGIDFISDEYINANRSKIGDVGYDNNINYELLLALNPDLVLLYGIAGASGMESKLAELQIPYIYLGEYLESSPLGKAEWLMPVGHIAGRSDEALQLFQQIESSYSALSKLSTSHDHKPRVMLNTPYRDSWFIPSKQSYMVQLISDAGAECYTSTDEGNSSHPIDTEQAYVWAAEADYWLNVGPCNSLAELTRQNPKFADIDAVTKQRVYNNNARQTPSSGSDFWESGVVRPDLILRDMIAIFHPELLGDKPYIVKDGLTLSAEELYYYKRLK
ncbi:MAG: ABC transporter substrate-binding protein [Alistipes sp.]|nr:ABC transporter substrate-binding protein [Alistipes sp.]